MGKKSKNKTKSSNRQKNTPDTPADHTPTDEPVTAASQIRYTPEDVSPRSVNVVYEKGNYGGDMHRDRASHSSSALRYQMAHRLRQRVAEGMTSWSASEERLRNMPRHDNCPEMLPLIEQYCENISAEINKVSPAAQGTWEMQRMKWSRDLQMKETADRQHNLQAADWKVEFRCDEQANHSYATIQYTGVVQWNAVTLVYYFMYNTYVDWTSNNSRPGQSYVDTGVDPDETSQAFYCIYDSPSCDPTCLRDIPALHQDDSKHHKRTVCNHALISHLSNKVAEVSNKLDLTQQLEVSVQLQRMQDALGMKDVARMCTSYEAARDSILDHLQRLGAAGPQLKSECIKVWVGAPRSLVANRPQPKKTLVAINHDNGSYECPIEMLDGLPQGSLENCLASPSSSVPPSAAPSSTINTQTASRDRGTKEVSKEVVAKKVVRTPCTVRVDEELD